MDKRQFLKNVVGTSLTWPLLSQLEKWASAIQHMSVEEAAKDEVFWSQIRSAYRLKSDYINLENGYYCIIPQETLENYIQHIRHVNYEGSHYMRTVQWDNKDYMAAKMAHLIHAREDEVIITRNTTESLDTIISGMDWKKGDEAVFAIHDYGAMRNQFALMARRYGIKNNVVTVPLHPFSDEEIVDVYAAAITEKTRLLMVCHMINITGHILPVRKICDMAHARGVAVMVDGAHAVGHIQVDMKALDCDYYGSSLHKWTSVPLGAGLLYVKKGKAKDIWPLYAEWGKEDDDIKKLNHTGTHPVAIDLAISNAIDFLQMIGLDRKEARLRYLQNRWTDQVRGVAKIIVNTPVDRHRSCGIANVGIEDMPPAELADTLLKDYNLFTVAIDNPGVQGCRITPNVYTSLEEVDALAAALKDIAARA